MLRKIDTGKVRLAYRIDGPADRPWVVMSHSLACDHSMWDAQMGALGGFRVLRFDSRGHGASDAPEGRYTIEDLAGDVLGLLDALRIDRCHFVGLSMGGMIGQQLALQAPERIASLVLADTSSRYPASVLPVWDERIALVRSQGMQAVVQATLERWFTAKFRNEHPQEVARIGALISATPVAGYVGCAHAVPRINFTARLATIRRPTLVIVGAEDLGTPVAMAEEIAAAIPGAELRIIDAAAHLSNIEQAVRFNQRLGAFLAQEGS
ncbi:MAG TPA: 3-oxoadipate enol-lactonase [Burkholderiaceae bacterium]|nr:3-oxoadipate enol-lactonase [Burkholderiaceae bacterium]HQR69790.1 3-oxoadipate enol-lactonase [Burkholderiaceae bacterium]